MTTKGIVWYLIVLAFLSWCVISLRTDIAQIRFEQAWMAWQSLLLAALLSLGNYALRVMRWWIYLKRLKHIIPFGFTGLTYIAGFAFTLSPGKVGEMVRGRYYQKIGIPLSSTAAAFFIERFMDLLAMLALACLALTTSPRYENLVWGAGIVIIAILIVLALAPWTRISSGIQRITWLSAPLKIVLEKIFHILISAKVLLSPLLLLSGFSIALIAWGAEGIGLMVISSMIPNPIIDWSSAISIYSIAVIVGALSFLPGGIGGTEAVMIALLSAHGFALPDAILVTLMCRLLTLWFAIVIGWVAVFFLRHYTLLQRKS